MISEEQRRERQREYHKRWYQKNKAKALAKSREWHRKNPDKNLATNRRAKLKLRYGITVEQFECMIVKQNGQCSICSNKFKSRTDIHVDHDHTNGQLRDLLCRSCNVGIGLFNDSPSLTIRAAEYLSKWKK